MELATAHYQHPHVMNELLKQGFISNQVMSNQKTLFEGCIELGFNEGCHVLLKQQELDPTIALKYEKDALASCLKNNDYKTAKCLFENKKFVLYVESFLRDLPISAT